MKPKINLDAWGIFTSIACAIHCAILPLFLTSLPVFGINIIHNPFFEGLMIALAFCIGCLALLHGYRKHHHRLTPILVFTLGFSLLLMKQQFPNYEYRFLFPAVALILTAHSMNYFYCTRCSGRSPAT